MTPGTGHTARALAREASEVYSEDFEQEYTEDFETDAYPYDTPPRSQRKSRVSNRHR
jgi:hypothetical protein